MTSMFSLKTVDKPLSSVILSMAVDSPPLDSPSPDTSPVDSAPIDPRLDSAAEKNLWQLEQCRPIFANRLFMLPKLVILSTPRNVLSGNY